MRVQAPQAVLLRSDSSTNVVQWSLATACLAYVDSDPGMLVDMGQ